jgi:precorrin-2/cobalt-factor-2 C20-methyltransferase
MPGAFVGVGVGPGDPDLLTLKALRVLQEADRVFSPTMAVDAVGRAESIVRQADPSIRVERLVFAIRRDDEARSKAHAEAAARIVECLDDGERVAFITLGDPNVYSTFHHLAFLVVERRPHVPIATVPGIMAFQDLAARAGVVVIDGTERLQLVSAVDGPDAVDNALADEGAAVIVYKGGRHLPAIAERLEEQGRLDGAVFGELLGLPGERIGPVKEYADAAAAYLATMIVPPERRR